MARLSCRGDLSSDAAPQPDDFMANYRNILIGLPTMGGSMKTGTALSIVEAVRALEARGIGTYIHNVDSAEIVTARDMIANMALHSAEWDAILFIDSDMAFRPDLIIKLVEADAEVSAAACPRRQLDLIRFAAVSREHADVEKAIAQASDFTVNFSWKEDGPMEVSVQNGFVKAAAVGMAIALIGRSALTALVRAKLVSKRRDLSSGTGEPCYSFFEIVSPRGSRLGEDYSFCYRWTNQLKRDLLVCVDEEVTHIGYYPYKARFAALSND
jgi:hypothetical protein